MGARLPLCIVGSIMMFVSLLFPTIFCNIEGEFFGVEVSGLFYYWMQGYIFAFVKEEYMGTTYTTTYTHFRPDILGLICLTIIVLGGILTLVLGCATESKVALLGGLLGLSSVIFFYVAVLLALPITNVASITRAGYTFLPFFGFFVCIVGGILATIGGALKKY